MEIINGYVCNVTGSNINIKDSYKVTHNRLYRWGIKRDHTADVDLNYPLKWYVELIYRILGI